MKLIKGCKDYWKWDKFIPGQVILVKWDHLTVQELLIIDASNKENTYFTNRVKCRSLGKLYKVLGQGITYSSYVQSVYEVSRSDLPLFMHFNLAPEFTKLLKGETF
jgi:hypothetical protein